MGNGGGWDADPGGEEGGDDPEAGSRARMRAARPTVSSAPGGPQAIAVPKNDLVWKDCTGKGFGDAGARPTPGVKLECADYDADLDPIAGATTKPTSDPPKITIPIMASVRSRTSSIILAL